jgi:hypothetical protein
MVVLKPAARKVVVCVMARFEYRVVGVGWLGSLPSVVK